jgi:hypothetical protein
MTLAEIGVQEKWKKPAEDIVKIITVDLST